MLCNFMVKIKMHKWLEMNSLRCVQNTNSYSFCNYHCFVSTQRILFKLLTENLEFKFEYFWVITQQYKKNVVLNLETGYMRFFGATRSFLTIFYHLKSQTFKKR